ncbi:MAG: cysteine--tRNA ligase [Bacillota bacterium]|nr:MAG: cysteine--tRNA ligase [Bacillota bacterium]
MSDTSSPSTTAAPTGQVTPEGALPAGWLTPEKPPAQIRVYNTLTRRKEVFEPAEPGHVRIYACGVTPYAEAHIGHARPALLWSVIRKYLQWRGFRVTLVQNFTDVDDKIIQRARERGEDPLALAARYAEQYLDAMRRLGVEEADHYPRVSQHIREIVEMIRVLEQKGFAYAVDGDVFFDVTRFPDYGKLSGQRLEELMAGTRFETDERKRNPMDFALWKAAKPGEPSWDSPWGPGRPGWHIECSAMSLAYLGNGFDFHGGGMDLVFPHHENEIAQSEAYTGQPPFVRFWVHNGLVKMGAEKMSKSLGNVVGIDELLERHPAALIRFLLLNTHYRSPLEFSDQALAEARRGWQRLNGAFVELKVFLRERGADGAPEAEPDRAGLDEAGLRFLASVNETPARFDASMADDFNTPVAIAVLFDLARETNGFRQHLLRRARGVQRAELAVLQRALAVFERLGGWLLGILDERAAAGAGESAQLLGGVMELLLEVRQEARARKDWATADRIRDRLRELGIIVEDTPTGSRWKLAEDATAPGAANRGSGTDA